MFNQITVRIMRQGLNPKSRSRGGRGSNGKKGTSLRAGSIDSTSSARVRGNAHQLMDKYLALARDASASGDRVLAENYFQHADHYYRVMSSASTNNGRTATRQQLSQTAAVTVPSTDSGGIRTGEPEISECADTMGKTEVLKEKGESTVERVDDNRAESAKETVGSANS